MDFLRARFLLRGRDRCGKVRGSVGAVVPHAIDEEAWRPVHSAANPAEEIGLDLLGIGALLKRLPKLGGVEP